MTTKNSMTKNKIVLFVVTLCFIAAACSKLTEHIAPKSPDEDQLLDGPIEGLSELEKRQFLAGDAAFNGELFFSGNGLGPYFVTSSCGSCHAGDGKGHPFTTLTRFGQSDTLGNTYLHLGAPQLQNRALPGFTPEQLPAGASFSKFMPPANTGLGFLEALTDSQILANVDVEDANADGISGRVNYVTAPDFFAPLAHHQPHNGKFIGRFGKKAAAIDLLHQTVNAYNQDMGITSDYLPNEPVMNGLSNPYFDPFPGPEVQLSTIDNVVFYLRTLKAPVQRNSSDAEVIAGKQLFLDINCGSCHIPEWTTQQSTIAALSNKTFYPYTDLLLHDMGSGLDDGYTEGTALTPEWRTPPLWGLGLSMNSQGGSYFLMHDGRATSIQQAIELHGGEALAAKNLFVNLSQTDKLKLIKFLESL
ncbi:di-heme oxidoredictase family protein [Cytophaga aurantiaca]|uniref:di-heme oxidoredictase family protein n=1 Tax=Cytophaga aurantiaca TaxID=29530 RepID=UPI0003A2D11E|nr:di-heme oxidoredictase family protein [Cytophaga aurantiaca]